MKIAGAKLSGRMDRVSTTIQNRMEELDDQLQNVVSRRNDVRRREQAWKAGPLFMAAQSPSQSSQDNSALSPSAHIVPDNIQAEIRVPVPQDDIQAEIQARSIGALSEGRMRQRSRDRVAEAELISEAQDRAIVCRGREIGIRIGAAQRIASRERSVDSFVSRANSTGFSICGAQHSEDEGSIAGSSAKCSRPRHGKSGGH